MRIVLEPRNSQVDDAAKQQAGKRQVVDRESAGNGPAPRTADQPHGHALVAFAPGHDDRHRVAERNQVHRGDHDRQESRSDRRAADRDHQRRQHDQEVVVRRCLREHAQRHPERGKSQQHREVVPGEVVEDREPQEGDEQHHMRQNEHEVGHAKAHVVQHDALEEDEHEARGRKQRIDGATER